MYHILICDDEQDIVNALKIYHLKFGVYRDCFCAAKCLSANDVSFYPFFNLRNLSYLINFSP